MSRQDLENRLMEEGVHRLLHKDWKAVKAPEPCEHSDDGFIYEDSATKILLRCDKCGEYYEKLKTI